jgi:GWxTD domain-containing protein
MAAWVRRLAGRLRQRAVAAVVGGALVVGTALLLPVHPALAQAGPDLPAATAEMDAPAASSYLRQVFRGAREADYAQAAAVYLELIRHWGSAEDERDVGVVEAHVRQALLAVPRPERERLSREDAPGEALTEWWGRQDPFPATPRNDRVVEHLARVAYAEHHYAHAHSPLGFDERGEVYVRLGAPSQRRVIDYFRPELVQRIHELRTSGANSLLVSPGSFAASEVWYYHGAQPYHFFFVDDGRGFRVGEVTDIVPQHLRSAVDGGTGRGGAKADIVLEVLRTVYRQLAPFDVNYVERMHQVDNYVGQLEDLAQEESHVADRGVAGAANRRDYSAVARRRGGTHIARHPPDLAVQTFVEAARRDDRMLRQQREERAPDARSSLLDGIEPLALATRVARFLRPDGTTRAEVYWALEPGALPLSRALAEAAQRRGLTDSHPDHAVRATLIRNAARADREVERVEIYTVSRHAVRSVDPLGAHTLVLDGVGGGDDLAVQWDQVLAHVGEGGLTLGPQARLAVLRTASLQPLRADGRLEMSDLKPVLPSTEEPYPYERIPPALPLALYFEAYGLTFGPRDEIDLSVEYEVTLRREAGPFRRSRQETTSGDLITTVRGTRTEQYLILDTAAWVGAGEATVTVIVTDRTTGASVNRSVSFTLAEP